MQSTHRFHPSRPALSFAGIGLTALLLLGGCQRSVEPARPADTGSTSPVPADSQLPPSSSNGAASAAQGATAMPDGTASAPDAAASSATTASAP